MQDDGLTGRGIAALRAGDSTRARALLAAAVRADPGDAQAWLWLSGALDDPATQRECLERAVAIDPACEPARAGLAALGHAQQRAVDSYHEAHEEHEGRTIISDLRALRELRGENSITQWAPAPAVAERPIREESPAPIAWRAIWRHPRAAMRAALAEWAPAVPWLLASLAGVSTILALAAWASLGLLMRPLEILALALVVGLPAGAAALLLGSVLLRTGGWLLGGQASAGQMRVALGWAAIPAVMGLPLWLAQIALLPAASFGAASSPAHTWVAGVCAALHTALWLWSAALSLVGLSEAHQITLARAAASWLLAALVVAGAISAMLGGAALIIGLRGG